MKIGIKTRNFSELNLASTTKFSLQLRLQCTPLVALSSVACQVDVVVALTTEY